MSKNIKNRAKKFGLSPGSLIPREGVSTDSGNFSVFNFNSTSLTEQADATLEQCLAFADSSTVTWINVQGLNNPKIVEKIGRRFDLHPLILEDILNAGQISKLDDYQSALFIVLHVFYYNTDTCRMENEQVSLVLGPNYILSFSEHLRDVFGPIRERLRIAGTRMRNSGADYLCYALIDCVVDHHFFILEKVEGLVEEIDEEVFNRPDAQTMVKIQKLKREVIALRKSVWPQREVISQMRRLDTPLIAEQTKVFLHDVYDHVVQAIDSVDSFREMASSMLEVYLSTISNRMNEIMKVLTIVSTTFVPLTFIASSYGMNFQNMPELQTHYGYFLVLGVMALAFCLMLSFFWRKRWLGNG